MQEPLFDAAVSVSQSPFLLQQQGNEGAAEMTAAKELSSVLGKPGDIYSSIQHEQALLWWRDIWHLRLYGASQDIEPRVKREDRKEGALVGEQ